MTEIVDKYKEYALQRGGLLFFSPRYAIIVIKALDKNGVRILGLDAFRITENETQPMMDHSIDLSGDEAAWKRAVDFLEERIDSGLFFEIVADE